MDARSLAAGSMQCECEDYSEPQRPLITRALESSPRVTLSWPLNPWLRFASHTRGGSPQAERLYGLRQSREAHLYPRLAAARRHHA